MTIPIQMPPRFRALHIIGGLDPRFGGPVTALESISLGLLQEGVDMSIVTTSKRNQTLGERRCIAALEKKGVAVHIFRHLPGYYGGRWAVSAQLTVWLARNLRDYDVVHIYGAWLWSSLVAIILCRVFSRPCVFTPHESLTRFDIYKGGRWKAVIKRATKFVISFMHPLILFSSELEKSDSAQGLRTSATKIFYSPGYDTSRAAPIRNSIANDTVRIGFLGRNDPKKNLVLLIEALGRASKSANLVLRIAGFEAPPDGSPLSDLIVRYSLKDRVEWLGFVDSECKEKFFESIDIVCIPSAYEAFPMAGVESLSRGVPVAVSRRTGTAELVERYKCGLVFDPTLSDIEKALRHIFDTRSQFLQWGENARSAAKSELDISQQAKKLLKIYADAQRKSYWERYSPAERVYIQISSAYAPAWGFGGPVRMMYEYATLMARTCPTYVFTGNLDVDGKPVAQHLDDRCNLVIKRYPIWLPALMRRNCPLIDLRFVVDVIALIRSTKSSVILHICEFRGIPPLCAIAIKAMFGERVRLVHSAFGMLHYKKSRIRPLYDLLFAGHFLRVLDIALAQNEHEMEQYRNWMSKYGLECKFERIRLLPLSVERKGVPEGWINDGRKDRARKAAYRDELGMRRDGKVICFLGRFHPSKGILRLIDVFYEYIQAGKGNNTTLLIIGRDDGLLSAIYSKISSLGLQNEIAVVTHVVEERFKYYFASDVFVAFPTIYEETMLASVEALCCGTPLLLSREADIPYVANEGAGLVIDFTVGTATKALSDLLNNLEQFEIAAVRAATNFSSQRVDELFLKELNPPQAEKIGASSLLQSN